MTARPARARRLALALALAGIALGGCGKKGPPIAPELRLPAPVTGLGAHIDEKSVVLGWTIPRTRTDGSTLRDVSATRLYRREETEGTPVKPAILSGSRVVGYDEIATVRLDAPAPATVRGDAVQWVDQDALATGHRYVYVVTATDAQGRTSRPSERLVVPFVAAPGEPIGLEAKAGDRQVSLTWRAPTTASDGSAITGPLAYVVLRGLAGDAPLQIVAPGVTETSYVDRGLDNDTEYRYAVRAVRPDPRVAAAGPASTAITASPFDSTPPSPPTNLVAVPSPGAMRLAWNASPEPDVALYAVYRASGSGDFVRVGTAVAAVTTFVDRDVRSGASYRYVVTAIDGARAPNESARSNEATAAAP